MTRPEDAAAAVVLGVDAIGMIFVPDAARRVSIATAQEILAALGPFVTPVAVFRDASPDEILATAETLGIRTVQLHGSEPFDILNQLGRLRVIKAVRPDELESDWVTRPRPANLIGLLADSPGAGGTGEANDWNALSRRRPTIDRLVVAGGLTAETVGTVVRRLRPYGVDVSSGIESSKGLKSVEKMRAFVAAVWTADADLSGLAES